MNTVIGSALLRREGGRRTVACLNLLGRGGRSEQFGRAGYRKERRSVRVVIVLCRPSQGENLLLLGNARLKERRKHRVRMSSPFPPPFNNSSSQSGPPPCISDTGFFHKNTDKLWLDPTFEDHYGLKRFYRQSWEPHLPLEPGTHFPVEMKNIYQESFGTGSIFQIGSACMGRVE